MAPVLVLILMSAFNISVLISDKLIAGYATRQGARLAAELGSGGGTLTTSQIDQQVVQTVLSSAANINHNANYATVQEIDIYAPSAASGVFSATDPHDSFDGSGNAIAGSPPFPNTSRNQIPPNETSIGVRILWLYRPPTGIYSFSFQFAEYTVMKASPVLPG